MCPWGEGEDWRRALALTEKPGGRQFGLGRGDLNEGGAAISGDEKHRQHVRNASGKATHGRAEESSKKNQNRKVQRKVNLSDMKLSSSKREKGLPG